MTMPLRNLAAALFAATVIFCAVPSQSATQRSSEAAAKALLEKAVAHYRDAGRKQALADFNAAKSPYLDRDLYVLCIDGGHRITANGALPKWVGMSVDIVSDASGRPLGDAIIASVQGKSDGSVRYRMINPMTGSTEPKILYTARLAEDICGVGIYGS